MRTKLLKSKNVLLALLTAMLIACLAFAGLSFTRASADGVTFGNMYGDAVDANKAVVGGNAADGYTMTYTNNFWTTGATFVRLPVQGYSTGYLSFEINTPINANVRVFIFQGGGWWNTADIMDETVKAGKTRYVSVNVGAIIADFNSKSENKIDVSNFDLTFNLYETNGENTVTINNLRVTAEEVIPPAPEVPEVVEIGDWTHTDTTNAALTNGTLTDNGTSYTGLKVSYNKDIALYSRIQADVTNFDASKTPKLCVSFYADTDLTLGVWNGDMNTLSGGHNAYTAGYHKLALDVSGQTSIERLQIYLDSSAAQSFDGTKNVVFDYIGFYDDTKAVNVAVDKYKNAATAIFTADNTDNVLSLQWNAQAAVNQYPHVTVPVENWQPFNRFLILDMSYTDSARFRFFLNNGQFDEWSNPLEVSSLTNGYVTYEKGRQLICLDTQPAYVAGMITPAGENNDLYIYMFGGADAVASFTKGVTFNQIYFSETPVAPVSLNVTVNYVEGTVSFDDTKLEVSAANDFATLITNGGAVAPGKLYIRSKADNTMTAEIDLVKAELTQDNAPTAFVKENSISYTHVSGYEFKFGEEEWGATDHWDNLEANRDYTIQIRKLASDVAFASDPITVTVHIEGEYVPVSIDLAGSAARTNFNATLEKTETTLTVKYDAAAIGGNYYFVSIPVSNWRAGNQYLIVDFSVNEDTKLRFYMNSDDQCNGDGSPLDKGIICGDAIYSKGRYVLCLDTAGAYELGAIAENGNNKIYFYCDGGLNSTDTLNKEIKFNKFEFAEEAVESVALNVTVDYAAETVSFDDTKLEVSAAADFAALIAKNGKVGPGKLYIRSKANNEITAEITLVKAEITQENAPKAAGTETSISFAHATGYEFKFGDAAEWSTTNVWENLETGSEYTITMRKAATDSAFASNEITVTITVGAYEGASVDLENYTIGSELFTVKYQNEKLTLSWNAAAVVGNWINVNVPVNNWQPNSRYLIIDMTFSASADYRFFLNNGKKDDYGNPHESSALTEYVKYQKGRHIICLDVKAAYDAAMVTPGDNNRIFLFLRGDFSAVDSIVKTVTFNQIYFSETEVANVELTVNVDYKNGTVDYDDEKLEVATDSAFADKVAKGGKVQPGKLYIRSKANPEFSTELTLVKGTIFDEPRAVITKDSISFELVDGCEFKFGANGEWGTTSVWNDLTPDTEYVIYVRKAATEDSFASDEIEITKRTNKLPGQTTTNPNEPNKDKDSGCNCSGSLAGASIPMALLLLAGSWFIVRRRRSTK